MMAAWFKIYVYSGSFNIFAGIPDSLDLCVRFTAALMPPCAYYFLIFYNNTADPGIGTDRTGTVKR